MLRFIGTVKPVVCRALQLVPFEGTHSAYHTNTDGEQSCDKGLLLYVRELSFASFKHCQL